MTYKRKPKRNLKRYVPKEPMNFGPYMTFSAHTISEHLDPERPRVFTRHLRTRSDLLVPGYVFTRGINPSGILFGVTYYVTIDLAALLSPELPKLYYDAMFSTTSQMDVATLPSAERSQREPRILRLSVPSLQALVPSDTLSLPPQGLHNQDGYLSHLGCLQAVTKPTRRLHAQLNWIFSEIKP